MSDVFGDVMARLDEFRQNKSSKIDRVDKEAKTAQERLSNKLARLWSNVKYQQATLMQRTEGVLAANSSVATTEAEISEQKMTSEFELLLNGHDKMSSQTIPIMAARMDKKRIDYSKFRYVVYQQ